MATKLILSEVLKKKRMSRRAFAIKIGIDPKNVTRLFKADADPRLSVLAKYAKALGCRVRDLLKE